MRSPQNRMNKLLADADICVKCGLCLPHCPTYLQTQNENESPRGRISLIQAWAGGQLEASEKLVGHIDNCLLCRSCERVCPAAVPYGRLIDNFRNELYQESSPTLALWIMKKIAHQKKIKQLAQKGLKLYQTSRLQKTAQLFNIPKLFRLDRVDRLLLNYRAPTPITKNYYPALAQHQGDVGFFIGCMGELLDHETVNAAIKVLTTIGFNVHIPQQQTCCGALDSHDGDKATAEALAEINCKAFSDSTLEAIITIASGCGSQLKDYQNTPFAKKIIDISQFLMTSGVNLSTHLKPLTASVCVHTPCSLKNVMRTEQGAIKLLQQIPEINLTVLPDNLQCCGSAGSYMLEHPQMAEALLSDLLEVAVAKTPDYLATSNIGCSLHIAAGLRERGINLEVIHPVVLIARQMS
jgi:glycolate oxidase iron-sulfur subunit